ncbi:unnamed protein product [Paramecium octaurelia]|uniref:Uncharacterized protein n=1 Tax=Paramecium octaurelia TaxID=43137 RepID=A0A8S1UHZ5_PAROT|nr:unnamed protein product [Paramecium octaurelia]
MGICTSHRSNSDHKDNTLTSEPQLSYKSQIQQMKSIYLDADQLLLDEISSDADQMAQEKEKRTFVQREVPIQLLSEKPTKTYKLVFDSLSNLHRKVPVLSSNENSIIQKRKSLQQL